MEGRRMSRNIARIENRFIFNAQYKLGLREQKVLLYLIANIDPRKSAFEECIIPVKELEEILKSDGKKWGGIYQEMRDFCKGIISKQITFNSDILVDGRPMEGYINWFQSVRPVIVDEGVCIRFLFSEDLKPFLLQLKEYAQINRLEVAHMRCQYAIRLFQIFKAASEKQKQFREVVALSYKVKELKRLLGLEGKYTRFNNFRQRVLDVALEEINQQTSIFAEMDYIRNSKSKIIGLRFHIYPGKKQAEPQQLSLGIDTEKFDYAAFKKRFGRIYRQIQKDVAQQYQELAAKAPINKMDEMIERSTEGQCQNWFRLFVSKAVPANDDNLRAFSGKILQLSKAYAS
ncbi:MAG: replication initiation protein [Lewinellaceae bacterium]|nr:replication initiation protein [Lewinellaceae bacterium]